MTCQTDLFQHQTVLQTHFDAQQSAMSSQHFVSLFAWADFFNYDVVERPSGLFVFAHSDDGCFNVSYPHHQIDRDDIQWCFDLMRECNGASNVGRIEHVDEQYLDVFSEESFIRHERPVEYIYERDHIAALSGNVYKAKRHDVNVFTKQYDARYREYQPTDKEACLTLFDEWSAERKARYADRIYQSMLDENRVVHERLLTHADRLGLDVRVVEVDGRIAAYTAGFVLNEQAYCIYVEVASLAITGLPVFIFHKFCQDKALKPYRFVNCMDDFAMDNVKKAKLSYQPSNLLASYSITPKEI